MADPGDHRRSEGAAPAAPSPSQQVGARPRRADQGVPRRHGRRGRRQPARRPRRVRRPAGPVRLRQDDHAADDRRPRVPDLRRHRPRRPVARRPAAAQAADDDRLPALRPLPAPLGALERRVRAQDARGREGGAAEAGLRGARDGRPDAARRPEAEGALGRAAAARRARARPRHEAEGAAARRAARRPRPPAAAADARRAAQPPAPARA